MFDSKSPGRQVKDHVFHVWLSGNSPPAVFAALQSRAGVAEPSPKTLRRAGAGATWVQDGAPKIAKLPYFSGFMVDITRVNRGYLTRVNRRKFRSETSDNMDS